MPEPAVFPVVAPVTESLSLHDLCSLQQPPALLRMLHERARWFHEYPTRQPDLLLLEARSLDLLEA